MNKCYKVYVNGLAVFGDFGLSPLTAKFHAETDTLAISKASRLSSGIAIHHNITIMRVYDTGREERIFKRDCGKQEAW